MTEQNEKITAVKNSADLNKLEESYEAKIAELEQKALDWENAFINEKQAKKDLAEDYKVQLNSVAKERDEWKTEAHRNRKIQQSEKKTKEESDFLSELAKLQAKKGININE